MRTSHRVPRSSAFILAVAVIAALTCARLARGALTTTVVEAFDGTLEEATWRIDSFSIPGTPLNDRIEPSGGSPGAFLHNPEVVATAPVIHYAGLPGTPFLGDYRAASVVSLGIDVNVFSTDANRDGPRKLGLIIRSGTDTPDNAWDDCEIDVVGTTLPQPGSGWKRFTFKVPSSRTSLPPDWEVGPGFYCNGLSGNDAWNEVITHVTQVLFVFSGGRFATYRNWDIAIDTVGITSRSN
jgi:hypothetical protein